MTKYTCERCLKEFSQKSHYDKHKMKKRPCQDNKGKIEEVVENIIINKKLMLNHNDLLDEKMKTCCKLGQYFTTNIGLKKKILEFVMNNPDVILEPSVGQGDLIQIIYENDYKILIRNY